eukprot:12311553-Karenia_brevis.AAC.2
MRAPLLARLRCARGREEMHFAARINVNGYKLVALRLLARALHDRTPAVRQLCGDSSQGLVGNPWELICAEQMMRHASGR